MRSKPQTYALTTVTHDRTRLFQRTANAKLFLSVLFRYRNQNRYLLHGFVIMPDHMHVLITPAESIEKSAQLIKGGFSFAVRNQFKGSIWQIGFHEHRVRNLEDFHRQLDYIANNPVKRGYEDYRFVHANFPEQIDSALHSPWIGRRATSSGRGPPHFERSGGSEPEFPNKISCQAPNCRNCMTPKEI